MTLKEINKLFGVKKLNQSFYYSKKKYKDYTSDMSSTERFAFGQSIVKEIRRVVEVIHPLKAYHKKFFVDMGFDEEGKGIAAPIYTVNHLGRLRFLELQQTYIEPPYPFELSRYLLTNDDLPEGVKRYKLKSKESRIEFISRLSDLVFEDDPRFDKGLMTDHSHKNRQNLAERLYKTIDLGWSVKSIYTKLGE